MSVWDWISACWYIADIEHLLSALMGNTYRPYQEIFCTESGRIKKNEEASCQSAGGNLLQIHCTSSNLWYCVVGNCSYPIMNSLDLVQARAARVIHQDKKSWKAKLVANFLYV